jgi:signal transduction histidine kinase
VSAVAHELRNPAQAILFAAHALAQGSSPDQQRRYCAIVVRELELLGIRLDRLRSLNPPTAAAPEPLPVTEVIDECVALLKARLQDSGAATAVSATGPIPAARAGRYSLRQALLAVLANAAEAVAGCGGGQISIAIGSTKRHVTITVADSGPGIPSDLQQRVLDPFFTTHHDRGALGLGLSAARSLLAQHGGHIKVLPNATGGGAQVRLRLPTWAAPDGPPGTVPVDRATQASGGGAKALHWGTPRFRTPTKLR